MCWSELKQLMIEEYCPHEEMQKLEHKLWNLIMNEARVATYTSRFDDLATLCLVMVTP